MPAITYVCNNTKCRHRSVKYVHPCPVCAPFEKRPRGENVLVIDLTDADMEYRKRREALIPLAMALTTARLKGYKGRLTKSDVIDWIWEQYQAMPPVEGAEPLSKPNTALQAATMADLIRPEEENREGYRDEWSQDYLLRMHRMAYERGLVAYPQRVMH